jgi:hypothetical protein
MIATGAAFAERNMPSPRTSSAPLPHTEHLVPGEQATRSPQRDRRMPKYVSNSDNVYLPGRRRGRRFIVRAARVVHFHAIQRDD